MEQPPAAKDLAVCSTGIWAITQAALVGTVHPEFLHVPEYVFVAFQPEGQCGRVCNPGLAFPVSESIR